MKISINHIILTFLLCLGGSTCQSQSDFNHNLYSKPYIVSAGLKIGNVLQLDYKQFINSELAINVSSGIFIIDKEGIFTSATITYHHDTSVENLYWFYGGGFATRISKFPTEIGMAGSIGFEAASKDKIINFFVDIQPTAYYALPKVNIFGGRNIDLKYAVAASIGLRLILRK